MLSFVLFFVSFFVSFFLRYTLSDGVLLCDGRLSAIDLAEPLVDP